MLVEIEADALVSTGPDKPEPPAH